MPCLLATGCSTMSHTEKGVGLGGLIGAGTGAIVGSAVGKPGAGAAIGAGVGAVSGGLVGHAVDESEKKATAQAVAAERSRAALGLIDVVQLAQQHVSDDVIIGQIRSSGSVFHLSSQDIIYLKQNGVSDPVIREMQLTATAVRGPRRIYAAVPAYPPPPPPVIIVEPPPPVVGFGIHGHFRH